MVVLDTNIIIDHIRRKKDSDSILVKIIESFSNETFAISIISIQELYEGKSTKDRERLQDLQDTLKLFEVLSYSEEVAILAGTLSRDLKRPIELADAAIAATTIINDAKLLTLNRKDFLNIRELELIKNL